MYKQIKIISIIAIMLSVLILSVACTTKIVTPIETATFTPKPTPILLTQSPIPTPTFTIAPTVQIDAPDVIGLYILKKGTNNRVLISEFNSMWKSGTDIKSFNAIASNEEILEGSSYKQIWNKCWNEYTLTDGYKIGYYISFTLYSGETIEKTLINPSDIDGFSEYVEVYIYDSINQVDGVRYTHLSESDISEKTKMTTIKLTAGKKIDEVDSINLLAFIYSSVDDFDAVTKKYIGAVCYEISVNRTLD